MVDVDKACRKIGIGTVQFGLEYGINNSTGMVSDSEIIKIETLARGHNIDLLDTAYSYGSSEQKIGEHFLRQGRSYNVVSKLPPCDLSKAEDIFHESLKRLGTDHMYGYLLHSFEEYLKTPQLLEVLLKKKNEGYVEAIGFSLYMPNELEYLFEKKIEFDLVQVPFSLLDQRFGKHFKTIKERNIEIHIRSVFLQGLLMKKSSELSEQFQDLRSTFEAIETLEKGKDLSRMELCLNFALLQEDVDKVIVGIDNSRQFAEILRAVNKLDDVRLIGKTLASYAIENGELTMPSRWKT
jgi:aryl-alcohol dehydrogenase-like predicted oxidoreductase